MNTKQVERAVKRIVNELGWATLFGVIADVMGEEEEMDEGEEIEDIIEGEIIQ